MPLTESQVATACTQPDAATANFSVNHTMYRVRNPAVSLDFYTRVLGMRLLQRVDLASVKLSLYLMGYELSGDFPPEGRARAEWAFSRRAVIELTHAWGTETDTDFAGYSSGNGEPGKGFGHIAIQVPSLEAACARFESLGVKFLVKPNSGPAKGMAFIADPDGYWIEILQADKIAGSV